MADENNKKTMSDLPPAQEVPQVSKMFDSFDYICIALAAVFMVASVFVGMLVGAIGLVFLVVFIVRFSKRNGGVHITVEKRDKK